MMMNILMYIGNADGPTSIFFGGKLGANRINVFGIVLIVLLLIPNIIFAVREKDQKNLCTNRFMNVLEQIGRYGCMFLMVFNIGSSEFGFPSNGAFLTYLLGNAVIMIAYWIVWIMYFRKKTRATALTLAILPTCLFLLSGITLLYPLLMVFSAIFGAGHIYVTVKNN